MENATWIGVAAISASATAVFWDNRAPGVLQKPRTGVVFWTFFIPTSRQSMVNATQCIELGGSCFFHADHLIQQDSGGGFHGSIRMMSAMFGREKATEHHNDL